MLCMRCGKALPDTHSTLLCSDCKPAEEAVSVPRGEGEEKQKFRMKPREDFDGSEYAGFWLRLLALLFDQALIALVLFLVLQACFAFGFTIFSGKLSGSPAESVGALLVLVISYLGLNLILSTLGVLLYHVLFECSPFRASFGKMLFGLEVLDSSRQPLGFCRALARNVCKLLSVLSLFFGFVMAGITKRKQALHDMVADTLVVKTRQMSPLALVATILLTFVFFFGANFLTDSDEAENSGSFSSTQKGASWKSVRLGASRASAGDANIELRSAVAVLGEFFGKPVVEIHLFSESLSDEQSRKLASLDEVFIADKAEKLIGLRPIMTASLYFEENARSCRFSNLRSVNLTFFKSAHFDFPIVNSSVQVSFAASPFEAGTYGMYMLSCNLAAGETLRLRAGGERRLDRKRAKLAEDVTELPVWWRLDLTTKILSRPKGSELKQKYQKLRTGMTHSQAVEIMGHLGKVKKRCRLKSYSWTLPDRSYLEIGCCGEEKCRMTGGGMGESREVYKKVKSDITPETVARVVGRRGRVNAAKERIDYVWNFGDKGLVWGRFEKGVLKSSSMSEPVAK